MNRPAPPTWWRSTHDPWPETLLDNVYNNHLLGPNVGLRREFPAEMPYRVLDRRTNTWRQCGVRLQRVPTRRFFVRPHDGKNTGWVGRMKDVFTGQGADVWVTASRNERTLMRDRPQRWQWSGWGLSQAEIDDRRFHDRDFRPRDIRPLRPDDGYVPWVRPSVRAAKPYYDFNSRKFVTPAQVAQNPGLVWSNVQWPDKGERAVWGPEPWSIRDGWRQWRTRVPANTGMWSGGRS